MRYIGGKTQLLGDIEAVINRNVEGRESVFCDIFSGSGSVARHFKPKYEIHSNDMLHFSYVIQKATVENNRKPLFAALRGKGITDPLGFLERADLPAADKLPSFVADNYAPGARCPRMYISRANAERVDFIRGTIESWKESGLVDESEYYYLLASLIEGVPSVSNITGTYGAYLKEWDRRALKPFEMARLDVTDNGRPNRSHNSDANRLIREIDGDILYIDPPYNSRQYASNYHLLETISRNDSPAIRGVTGMRPCGGLRSAFCVKSEALEAFEDLVAAAKFPNIVMSYSTDGLMTSGQIEGVLRRRGEEASFRRYDIPYRRYRSKIPGEAGKLQEYLFYARKKIPKPEVFLLPPLTARALLPPRASPEPRKAPGRGRKAPDT
ncbi:MAG: DNA adenine methylase [Deltaproteobacteria bacterium]|jgi:adenine-specific DNA-methyltransferase|nr:DNA adenine methylase [Deltaproteobacteria bacterium]